MSVLFVETVQQWKVFVSVQNFEAAVQDNLLVNGQPWEEAPDAEGTNFLGFALHPRPGFGLSKIKP